MTTLFSDDFNRANGPIGNDWVQATGNWETYNNYARGQGASPFFAVHAGGSANPDQAVSVTILQATIAAAFYGVVARSDVNCANCYYVRYYWYNVPSTNRLELRKIVGGTDYLLYIVYYTPSNDTDHRLTLECVGTRISVRIDGTLYLTANDADVPGGDYFGMYSSSAGNRQDNFTAETAASVGLSVAPPSVPAGSAGQSLTLTSTNSNWTPGTPGSPTFTADIGTITAQTVIDGSTAVLTYDAPGFQCTDTLRDPLNGTFCSLGIGLEVLGDIQEVLRRLGIWPAPSDVEDSLVPIYSAIQPTILSENPSAWFTAIAGLDFGLTIEGLGSLLFSLYKETPERSDSLWTALLGILALQSANRGLGIDTNLEVHTISTLAHYSLLDVMNTIRGPSFVDNTNLWDYLHDLATPNGYNLGSIILAIEGVRGTDNRNLTQIYNLLTSPLPVDLSDVLEILNNLTANDTQTLQTVLNAIAQIPTNPITDLTPVLLECAAILAAIAAHQLSLDGYVDALINTPAYGLHPIKDQLEQVHTELTDGLVGVNAKLDAIIAAIAAIEPGGTATVAPVWPGLANVTLGSGVPLSAGFVVPGPLDGVLIDITGVPPNTGQYSFNGTPSWTHVGAVAFITDRGDHEAPQTFGFEHAILTPRCQVRAASAVGRAKQALTGTVYPWTINP